MVKKEISSVQNWKEAFWETALCSVNSYHRVTSFPSTSLSQRLFLCNWQFDICKPIEGYGEKGNIFSLNWKEAFWETALCSVNSSHRVTALPCRSLPLRLFWWNWQRDIWKPIEGYGEKGNIFRSKLERSFLRNCSVFCKFISQSYIFPFKKPFAKTVFLEFAKWYFEVHRGLVWKRKYLPLKTAKKLSEKLLCVMLIHLTELQLSPQEALS